MTWGSFGIVHLASLAVSAGMVVGLYFLLRRMSARVQTLVLGVLSFAGLGAIVFNLLMWDSPLEYLPLHLCSVNALILPVAVFTKNRILNNLLLLWALGALLALVVNTAQADFVVLSWTFVFYYFPHTVGWGVPVLMFLLGLARRDVRCIVPTISITVCTYTLVHLINLYINDYCLRYQVLTPSGSLVRVNYMYSLNPENPVLSMLYGILPEPFWYMFLVIPLVFVYLCIVYSPDIIKLIRSAGADRAQT